MAKKFAPSPYQQAIFDWVRDGSGSAIVVAVAGSGKTTTVINSFDYIPSGETVVYLVFNKRNQEEAATKVPAHVRAMTFHSAGFGAYRRAFGNNVTVDQKKTWNIIRNTFGQKDVTLYAGFVQKLVGLAKQSGVGFLVPDEPSVWFDIMDHHDIYTDKDDCDETRGVELARETLRLSTAMTEVLDYDDMLYMPVVHKCTMFANDWVFVDEAQDTNAIQRAMLKKMLKPRGGRLVAVGDPSQAIYGFRGADSDSMYRIQDQFGCVSLPLTVSFRCPQAVVRLAQEFAPHIEAHPDAPEGIVRSDTLAGYIAGGVRDTDMILCRTTAPLIQTAFTLIKSGIACHVLGREIGRGLSALIEKQRPKGIDSLVEKLGRYLDRETAKWLAKDREDKVQAAADRVACISALIDHLPETTRTVPALISLIDSLFSEDTNKVTLCTIHKAKGLERPRVVVLYANSLMPSPWARQKWQLEQEYNGMYVAYTRAMAELVFVE
jgi:DNA helicase-2/ATP-dependent DNA helicase PcrA